ncbi:MAG TPA: caspase family protein, partial [Geminicoccaceae bacterium]|nr:caspase family protein [Geminicoccaceae bacterium]
MRSLAHLLARLTVSACLGTAALVIAAAVAAAATEQRVALVIGNGAYRNTPALPNPVADAQAMAATLERVGFEVILREDLNKRAMEEALRDFGRRAAEADVALVYYAGHGLQVAEENYLLPVEAALQRERDLLYEALPLDIVLGEVAQARSLGLVILDACRNNPLADRLADRLGIRADRIGSGLARIDDVPTDTLVAFATRPSAVAEDGSEGNSPYTRALLEHLATPNLELSLFFRRVRDTVLTATDGRQEPFTYGSLGAEPFYFNRVEPNREPVVADAPPLEVLDSAGPTPLAIAAPTDPDGDPLTVAVTGLPRGGEVRVGGRAVRVGDWLTVEQLAAAGYSPDRSLTGDAGAFEFRVEDDRGGTALGHVRVAVLPSNRAPVVEAERALTAVANPLGLREPSDPDGDPVTITVVEVPSRGAVRSGERAVGPGDELTPADLTALRYDPEADFAGDAGTFVVAVEDGRGERVTSTVRIDVVAPGEEGEAPVVAAAVPAVAGAPPEEAAAVGEQEAPVPPPEDELKQRRVAALTAVAPPPAEPAAPVEEAAPAAEPATSPAVAMVDANVRERPTTSSDRVARIRKGDAVRVTGGRVA